MEKIDLNSLVQACISTHTPEELALGWLRYEALRRVSPRTFAEMGRRNLTGEFFDDIVTECLLKDAAASYRHDKAYRTTTGEGPWGMGRDNVS